MTRAGFRRLADIFGYELCGTIRIGNRRPNEGAGPILTMGPSARHPAIDSESQLGSVIDAPYVDAYRAVLKALPINEPPTVVISSPADGAELPQGHPISMFTRVRDSHRP